MTAAVVMCIVDTSVSYDAVCVQLTVSLLVTSPCLDTDQLTRAVKSRRRHVTVVNLPTADVAMTSLEPTLLQTLTTSTQNLLLLLPW